jgi:hypothetical protein
LSNHAHPINVEVNLANKPKPDTENGNIGNSELYARADHEHPMNVSASIPVMDTSTGSAGSSSTYSRADHSHPTDTTLI